MTETHTPERWPDPTPHCTPSSPSPPCTAAQIEGVTDGPIDWEHARRIVACVNALAGHNPGTVTAKLGQHKRLVERLESASVDYHDASRSLLHEGTWEDCGDDRCRSDRALLRECEEAGS